MGTERLEKGDRSAGAMKEAAQFMIMDAISTVRGYWEERFEYLAERMTARQRAKFDAQLQKQADRCARIMGYEASWTG